MERLIDKFGRKIDCLRISVTDRCNLKCLYCMPENGIKLKDNKEILSYDEIFSIIKIFSELGVNKIKITGGEPLVRNDIVKLIHMIAKIKNINDISMTTNGTLLNYYAVELKNAGLKRLNISLDTLNSEKYKFLTRTDNLNFVLNGIETALKMNFSLVKINVVLLDINKDEINQFLKLSKEEPLHIRFLEYMPINNFYKLNEIIKADEVINKAYEIGEFETTKIYGNNNSINFRFKGAKGTFGIIAPMSYKFCYKCNRLRLTAEGFLKLCLNSKIGINLKKYIREGIDEANLKKIINQILMNKPFKHNLSYQSITNEFSMCQIGG